MKIIHLCLAGMITEGWSYQENMLIKYHKIMGHDVTVITSQWIRSKNAIIKNQKTNYTGEFGAFYVRLPISNHDNIGNRFKRYHGVVDAIEKIDPDIIFIHNFQFLDIKKIVSYLKTHKVKVFVDNHSDFSNSCANLLSWLVLHKIVWGHFAKMVEPYVTQFYGVLPARVDFLKDVYSLPPQKCSLLLMGADDELVKASKESAARERIRRNYHIADDEFLIVTGGKIDKAKKQTILLMKAVHNINDIRLRLIVFGSVDDCLKHDFNSLCDGKKIQYAGWVDSPSSYDLFEASDLVVFPGRHSVYWEQVAGQEKPMIIKDWPNTHHVDQGGNVIFLKEDSVQEIQQSIEKVLHDSSFYQNMKSSAEKNGKRFFYSQIAKESISL